MSNEGKQNIVESTTERMGHETTDAEVCAQSIGQIDTAIRELQAMRSEFAAGHIPRVVVFVGMAQILTDEPGNQGSELFQIKATKHAPPVAEQGEGFGHVVGAGVVFETMGGVANKSPLIMEICKNFITTMTTLVPGAEVGNVVFLPDTQPRNIKASTAKRRAGRRKAAQKGTISPEHLN